VLSGSEDGRKVNGSQANRPSSVIALTVLLSMPTADADSDLPFLAPLRGLSGAVRVVLRLPGSELSPRAPGPGVTIAYEPRSGAAPASERVPEAPGAYDIVVKDGAAARKVKRLTLVTLVPFAEKKEGRIGGYSIGFWPFEASAPRSPAYASPTGFVEVTKENRDLKISSHLELRDFLSREQDDVWPKYLVLEPRLLDKLELIMQELDATARDVDSLHVMSGFRTPVDNESGGDTQGRGRLSRHMWGDAADVWVDDDGNGVMDDLNDDGRIDVDDARVVVAAAERVEARHPALGGGLAPYPACCGHGPFAHVDARGSRARWLGRLQDSACPGASVSADRPSPRAGRD
jgi:hypothetical protein